MKAMTPFEEGSRWTWELMQCTSIFKDHVHWSLPDKVLSEAYWKYPLSIEMNLYSHNKVSLNFAKELYHERGSRHKNAPLLALRHSLTHKLVGISGRQRIIKSEYHSNLSPNPPTMIRGRLRRCSLILLPYPFIHLLPILNSPQSSSPITKLPLFCTPSITFQQRQKEFSGHPSTTQSLYVSSYSPVCISEQINHNRSR